MSTLPDRDHRPGFGIELMRLAATLAEPLVAKQTISSLVETAGAGRLAI